MSDLRFTDTNAGDDSTGRAFGLDGNLYLPVVVSAITGVGLGAGLHLGAGVDGRLAGAIGAMPGLAALGWAYFLRQGRAPGYAKDKLDCLIGGGHFSKTASHVPAGREHGGAPDGAFVQGMLLYGSPERGGIVSKGFRLEPPDQRGAGIEQLNALQDRLCSVLALTGPGRRLQFQWSCDSNYRPELERYHAASQGVENLAIRTVRNERVARYAERMRRRTLRRERLAVFLSIEIESYSGNLRGHAGLETHYDALLQGLAAQFEEFASTLRSLLGPDTPVRPMDDLDHFDFLHRFLNPSLDQRPDLDSKALFDPELSIHENCWHGDGIGQPDGGFVLDRHHHAVISLARWPQRTRPGIVTHLTGMPFLDYAITVNLTPIAPRHEIHREERAAERLRGEYAQEPRPSLLVALRKKERKVEQLAGGFARPFHVTYAIRCWAPTRDALRDKVAALQAAIHAMDGAQYHECALPTTARNLFFGTWPGWTHSSCHDRELYAEGAVVADLLPFSATFTGALAEAEAIYDGSHQNLVGVSTQTGGSPQHTVLFGMTGAGKSAFMEDFLLQSAPFFEHTIIVEEGLSYERYTRLMGERPIVVHPDAQLTFNYFDTQGLPLTRLHLATVAALLAHMAGETANAAEVELRQAQLSQYLAQLYHDTFTDWARRKPERAARVRKFACAVHHWRERSGGEATLLDAFIDLRDRINHDESEALEFFANVPEAEVTRFCQAPETSRVVEYLACAYYRPAEFPTHAALVELLAFARMPEHNPTDIERLATLLRAWTADGQYGRLFDGPTDVTLDRPVVHFELGQIPEQAVALKAAVGILISGMARQRILALPRNVRKRIVFEELSRFLDIPGGEQIVAEGYAQLRKYNCWVASIVQQYGRFRTSRIRSAVIGNAKQFFLMRQSDRSDLADLSRDLPLPESAAEAIQRYPLPEQQPADAKYSSLCYFQPTAQPPQCGTLRHLQPHAHAPANLV